MENSQIQQASKKAKLLDILGTWIGVVPFFIFIFVFLIMPSISVQPHFASSWLLLFALLSQAQLLLSLKESLNL